MDAGRGRATLLLLSMSRIFPFLCERALFYSLNIFLQDSLLNQFIHCPRTFLKISMVPSKQANISQQLSMAGKLRECLIITTFTGVVLVRVVLEKN